MNILVTGVSGGYGSYAIKYLKQFAPEANIYGLVRSADKGKYLAELGLGLRIGDYNDLDSLVAAFEGIDRLLFVSIPTPGVQHKVVRAAQIAGVKYIAYTSIFDAEGGKMGLEVNHLETEELIKQSGIPYVILRNAWYLGLHQGFVELGQKTGTVYYHSGEQQTTGVLRRELAEAGARVIADGSYRGVLDLASSPFTYGEFALALQQALGRELEIKQVDKTSFEAHVAQVDFSPLAGNLIHSFQDYVAMGTHNEGSASAETIEQILARPLTPLGEALKEILDGKEL